MPGGGMGGMVAWTIDQLGRTNPGPHRSGPGINRAPKRAKARS